MAEENFIEIQDRFVQHWGRLGSAWGVNRTMTQIHALLMVNDEPLTTDDIMDRLKISRGNAHKNLKELSQWGVVRSQIKAGDRKDYFVAEKEPWKMLCMLARERKRREIEPALEALEDCLQASEGMKGEDSKAFREQLKELQEFLEMADRVLGRLGRSEKGLVLKWLTKMI